jgi:hypothetical protein
MKRVCLVLVLTMLCMGLTGVARAGSAYTIGDVFLDGVSGGVNEYTPSGTLVQTISNASLAGTLTGMAFDSSGNLLVTNFGSGNVVQMDNSGNLKNATFATGMASPEAIAIDAVGHVYVSSVGGTGITEYNSTGGAAIGTSIAGTRSDWIDLASDQHTMLYTQETSAVHSVDVSTHASNPDVANTGGGHAALRIVPTGAFAGDILVSDESSGNPQLLSPTGTVLKTYTGGGLTGTDFALNIDPNGTDFWTADAFGGHVAEFNIATGVLDHQWTAGGTIYGLVVFGQKTASGGGGGGGGGNTVPEPGSLSLLACGFVALASLTKLRRLVNV